MTKLMRTLFAAMTVAAMMVSAPGLADDVVVVEDPTGEFSGDGGSGYVQVTDEGVVRACNENEGNPAGDEATGYIWVNPTEGGESTTPTYGTSTIGAGDADGEGQDDGDETNGTETDDCPDAEPTTIG